MDRKNSCSHDLVYLVKFGFGGREFVYYSNDLGSTAKIIETHLDKSIILDFLNVERLRSLQESVAS